MIRRALIVTGFAAMMLGHLLIVGALFLDPLVSL